jgi:hypothetical protein
MFVLVDIGNLDMITSDHVVIDGNLCRNLGLSRGRLSNIYYRC